MDDPTDMQQVADALVNELIRARKVVATAESCTGGWISKAITDVSGSSACFGYGLVTYSNSAKKALLGVAPGTLREHGAVSESVVLEMVESVLTTSGSDLAIAVSGVAGPTGGTEEKPVGTVWFGWASYKNGQVNCTANCQHFSGDREDVRVQTVIAALLGFRERLKEIG